MLALRTLCAALSVMLGQAGIAHAAEAPPRRPIIDFAALPAMQAPTLSPNGRKIAARIASKGKLYLAVLDFDGAPPVVMAVGETDLNWWRWVNDGWLVVGIGNPVPAPNGGEDMYVRRAISISADGKTVNKLAFREAAQGADDVLWTARDGSPRILLAVQKSIYLDRDFWPEVMEMNVSTGKSRRVVAPHEGVMSWYADANGTVRMGIGASLDGASFTAIPASAISGRWTRPIAADVRR